MRLNSIDVRRLVDREWRRHALHVAADLARGRSRGFTDVRIASGVRIAGPGTLTLSPGSRIRQDCHIWVGPGATLTVGSGTILGIRGNINVATGLTIGAGAEMSWDCRIMDTDFHTIYDEDGAPRPATAPIVIGDEVLLGAGCTILKGVTIGDGAVIAAAAVVTRDVAPHTVAAGNPARAVGSVSRWE